MSIQRRQRGRLARWRQGLRQAFALEDPCEALSVEDRLLLTKVADFVVKRKMTVPAILFLESLRPLNFIGSQVMVFFQPILASFFSMEEYDRLARILERRDNIDRLTEQIEETDRTHRSADR